jgi:hypothetical protein
MSSGSSFASSCGSVCGLDGLAWLIICIICGVLGYFVYGGIKGALAIILICLIYDLSTYISLVPVCGFILQGLVINNYIWPWVSEFMGIGPSWLTTLIFWAAIIMGFFTTCAITFMVATMVAAKILY